MRLSHGRAAGTMWISSRISGCGTMRFDYDHPRFFSAFLIWQRRIHGSVGYWRGNTRFFPPAKKKFTAEMWRAVCFFIFNEHLLSSLTCHGAPDDAVNSHCRYNFIGAAFY